MQYLTFLRTSNLQESRENLQKIIDEIGLKDRKHFQFWIENKITKEYIGEIGYNIILDTPDGKIATIVYFIKEKHWNKGYITEALKKLFEFAFNKNNVYRFIGECIKENVASEKIMIKCEMIKEGEFKVDSLHENKLKDGVQYRLLKHEWEKINN